MFLKKLYQWLCVRVFRFTGRALPSLEDRVAFTSTKFALCPSLTLGQGECLVTVQTPRAIRTFMIPPDLLRQIVQAISKLDMTPSSTVVPDVLEKGDAKAFTNKAEDVHHDLVLCQLVVDLLKAESELGIQTSGETLVLALIIFCKAAGIKVTDDWIDRALDSITSYRRTEG